MNKFSEFIFEYLRCLLEKSGFNKEIFIYILWIILFIIVFIGILIGKLIYKRIQSSKAAKNLAPYFSKKDVQQKLSLFIESKWQNNSPTREEEPFFTHKFVSKSRLIPHFINTAFNENKVSDKFYLVLADSGMGKTTFMINLYVRYNSLFNVHKKFKIKLIPFGYQCNVIEKIKEIKKEEIPNTILLLDAFDEYTKILPPTEPDGLTDDERFRQVLDELIETVQDFREVVITSRTQYFPGEEEQSYELKIPTFDNKGFHTLAKFYLSPFDDKEIRCYLDKKYGILRLFNHKKKQKALQIISNSQRLMVRPMLLSYIDYLVDNDQDYTNTYEIYAALIDKWIEREANKREHLHVNREKLKENLHKYSQLVAVKIYNKRKETNSLQLCKADAIDVDVELKDYQMTGQSLLTRDVENNWKFAHKSIFEFFIAKEAFENIDFALTLDFVGLQLAEQFYNELLSLRILPAQTSALFSLGLQGCYKTSNTRLENLKNIDSNVIGSITYLELSGNNLINIEGLKGLTKLEYIDVVENNIEIDKLIEYQKFLITKKHNYRLAILIEHQLVSIKWRRNTLKSDVLATKPNFIFSAPDNKLIPPEEWYLMIDKLKKQLSTFEMQTGINIKIEYFDNFIISLNDFYLFTNSESFCDWNKFYLKTLIIWKDAADIQINSLIDISKVHQPMTRIVYKVGEALDPDFDSEIFVGRYDLKEKLQHEIFTNNSLPLFLIYGQRRVGKTSFLKFLPLMLGNRFIVIYFDLQAVSSIEDWFDKMYTEFTKKLEVETPQKIIITDNKSWIKQWNELSDYFLNIVQNIEQKIVFAFDEYEKVHKFLEADQVQGDALLGSMRSFTQQQKKIIFLFVGSALFSELNNPNWALYFTHAIRLKVDYLSEEETLSLIGLMKLDFKDDLPDIIFKNTQGHPTLTQIICKELVQITYDHTRLQVDKFDLEDIINKKILIEDNGVVNVFWTEFCKTKEYKSIILKIIKKQNIQITKELNRLIQHDFVINENNTYKIRVPLFEKWIIACQKNHWY